MFDEILEHIKSTEANEEDLKQLAYFDIIPSQVQEILKLAVKHCNGGATATQVTLEWKVGDNYQERKYVESGEVVQGDKIKISGRFQYWEFCRTNESGEVIAFVRLRTGQVQELLKQQRFS